MDSARPKPLQDHHKDQRALIRSLVRRTRAQYRQAEPVSCIAVLPDGALMQRAALQVALLARDVKGGIYGHEFYNENIHRPGKLR